MAATADFPAWLALAFALAVAWRISRAGGGSAVSELSKANEVLTRRVNELGAEVRDLRAANAELSTRTDFAAVMEHHEQAAQMRSAATLRVLDLIASRLGPDE
jgi:outer membrane murein-binding lipoprotein Lpp